MIKDEGVKVDTLYGHGGIFKTKGVAQGILAAALNSPVSVMETAGEGGAWGMALLAAYMIKKSAGEGLGEYLNSKVFAGQKGETIKPDPEAVKGFDSFEEVYLKGLAAEKAAVENI